MKNEITYEYFFKTHAQEKRFHLKNEKIYCRIESRKKRKSSMKNANNIIIKYETLQLFEIDDWLWFY